MFDNATHPTGDRRHVRALLGSTFVVALAASFMAVFGMALAIGSSSEPHSADVAEKPGQYPATPRVEIGRGTIEGVGEYRLLYSRDHRGGICIGIEHPTPGLAGREISEGCGGPEPLNVGTLTSADAAWTVVHGKVPSNTKKLKIKKRDGSSEAAAVIDDQRGLDGKWVVHTVKGKLGDADFEAVDANGNEVASQRLDG
jgi:hypothetical protein